MFAAGTESVFCQTLTNALLRELRISPAPDQQLVVNNDIKFEVTIPYTLPSQIDISMPDEPNNVQFKTLRKVEAGAAGGGTKIELWFSFSKTGLYVFSPLIIKIKNSRRQLAFMPVTIGINPKEQEPLCVIVTDSGLNKNITASVGQTIKFRICLQYAVQLVQFNWELPKDSIFVQGKTYEFTEIKQREKVVSDALIPVSEFEWTPLVSGYMDFPKFNIQAIAYNGDKVSVKIPQIEVYILNARNKKNADKDSLFTKAFEQDADETVEAQTVVVTAEDAILLAELRSRERHSVFGRARKQRVEFEQKLDLPYSQKEFRVFWIYVCAFLTSAITLFLIICIRKKRNGLNLILGIVLVCTLVLLIYSLVLGNRKYGISGGGQICSIPEETASIKSELPVCNRVQLLDESDNWYHLSFGETEGWCKKEDIYLID